MFIKALFQKGFIAAGMFLVSLPVYAAADGLGFMNKIEAFACNLLSANGPLVPLLAGGAISIFAVAMMFGEEKGGLITTLIKVGLGISILVGIPLIAGFFGIGWNCSGLGSGITISL